MINDVLFKYAELLDACKVARLTGTRGAREIYELQIRDCENSLKFLPESGSAIDVGTGGGLPGIVWAVYRPDLKITLLDSIAKKCDAIREIAESLEISNVEIICARSEDFAKVHREEFDFAAAKAVASAGVTAELLAPLVKVHGLLLTFKGEKVDSEIHEVGNNWHKLGVKAPEINFYESNKCIVTWRKIMPCAKIFPRRAGLASSKKFWE